jgi:zinc transport system substrate-binding protein
MISNKQKIFAVSIVAILAIAGISAVVLSSNNDKEDTDKVSVVASFYPLGYLAEYIGGDYVSVTTLIPENTEVHSWSPSASDILTASSADVLLYNGAGLDAWVESDLLSSIDTGNMLVVKTTSTDDLKYSDTEASRIFVFDNDNSKTYVYDISEGEMVLSATYDMTLNAVASYSGYFDSAIEVTNSAGYLLLFIPNGDSITVLNTGLHGDHFHDAEIVTTITVGKPVHSCVSPDGQYVSFALDGDNAAIVIEVDAPANYDTYVFTGESTSSHATVVIDDNNMLYFADMKETQGSNLWIVNIETGVTVLSEGDGGSSPHGGFYSSATDKVYLNCADGIAVIGSNGVEKVIAYTHTDGARLTRSWLSEDGTKLISYVGNTATGLAYSRIVAYDLTTGTLTADIAVSVESKDADGWPSSILVGGDVVVISDPAKGTILLVDMNSKTVTTVDLDVDAPQAIRVVEDGTTGMIWAVCEDGTTFYIDPSDGSIITKCEAESGFGNNLVISVVTISSDEEDEEEALYDPHTWISPYMALKQAEAIYNALIIEDPEHADYYLERWTDLKEILIDLDEEYTSELADASQEVIFVNHEAYGYLAERYGFEQEGIIGISADEQPSVSAIVHIAEEMEEHGAYVIYLDPVYSDNYVNTLKETVEDATGHEVQILRLYLMTGEVDGLDYLEQMEANLEALKVGLDA